MVEPVESEVDRASAGHCEFWETFLADLWKGSWSKGVAHHVHGSNDFGVPSVLIRLSKTKPQSRTRVTILHRWTLLVIGELKMEFGSEEVWNATANG